MISELVHAIWMILFGLCLAMIEIEIEGKDGWAVNLPTWRRFTILSRVVFGGRPTTGYHMWLSMFLLLNFSFISVLYWMLMHPGPRDLVFAGLCVFGCATNLLLQGIFWDYWWFVFNPDFTAKGHNRDQVPWHPRWFGKWINTDHVVGLIGSLCVGIAGQLLYGSLFGHWFLIQFVAMGSATVTFIVVSPLYHTWRRNMKNGGPLYAEIKPKKMSAMTKETVEDAQQLMKQHMQALKCKST